MYKKIIVVIILSSFFILSCLKKNPTFPDVPDSIDDGNISGGGNDYGIVRLKYDGIWYGKDVSGEITGRKIIVNSDGSISYKEAKNNNFEEIYVSNILRISEDEYEVKYYNGKFISSLEINIKFNNETRTASVIGIYTSNTGNTEQINEIFEYDGAQKGLSKYAGSYIIKANGGINNSFTIEPDGSVKDLILGSTIEASDISRDQYEEVYTVNYIDSDGNNIKGSITIKEPFMYNRGMSVDIKKNTGDVSVDLIKGLVFPEPSKGTGFDQNDAQTYAGIWVVTDTDLKDSIFTIDSAKKNMEHAYVNDKGRNSTIYLLDVTNITKVNSSYKLDYYNWAIYDAKSPYKKYSQCRMDTTLTFSDNNNASMVGSIINQAGNVEKINMKLMRKPEFPSEFKGTTWTLTHSDGSGGGTRTLVINQDLSIQHTYQTKEGTTTTVKIPKEGVVEKFTGDPNKFVLEAGNGNNYPIPSDSPNYNDGRYTIEFILNIDKTNPNTINFYYKILDAIPVELSDSSEQTYTKKQ